MKHSNVIDLFKVCAFERIYGFEFRLKHQATLERIREQYHRRADAQKRGA